MRGAVVADEAGAVDGEDHRQALQADVLDEHVVGALQEGGVDGDHRSHAADGQPGGEDGGVLLGDADVVEALGEAPLERLAGRCPAVMAAVIATMRASASARRTSAWPKASVKVVPTAAAFDAVAEMERPGAVKRVRARLGRLVALALDRLDVDDDRPARLDGLADALAQGVHVVAVDDADVGEAELLEEHAGHEERLHRLLDVLAAAGRPARRWRGCAPRRARCPRAGA